MAWWNRKTPPEDIEERSFDLVSIGDPAAAEFFGLGTPNLAGVNVNEFSALGLAAVWRAVSLIASSIASLPLRTIHERSDGISEPVPSWLDNPGGAAGLTKFELVETMLLHLLLHGNAFLLHIRGGAGQMLGLYPIHPRAVSIQWHSDYTKTFLVETIDGKALTLTSRDMTHIPGLSTDGIRGLSPIWLARNSFGTSIAAERSASRLFSNGALISGLVTPEEGAQLTPEDATRIKESLTQKVAGEANAGSIAVINKALKFSPWSMNAADAQWLESRAFQVEDISRWFGVPPHLLGQTQKQTSFGAGLTEQNRGFARYTLQPWTSRIEERLSLLLPPNKSADFDYSQFVQPDHETEVGLIIAQLQAGLITVDEARRMRNLPPLPAQPQIQETDAEQTNVDVAA
ncbi:MULTISPECIES: phage portal protein [Mycobacterium]|uniref:phage portal protein n=1 Tax=Mycobacterium TaxID=1763 RepID=UPI0002AD0186|nr:MULTISPECIES: phage portal protein [Mycobacterium]ELR86098.1 phage portal protein, HK97 family [Mycobacterium sp. H4Y]